MPTYVLPQVQVFQDFTTVPEAAANPLRAHISGPHAYLLRYAEDDERALGLLGTYDRLTDTAFDWPQRPAGAKVDTGYVKVWIKDALLKYFEDSISAGSTIVKVSGYNNRVRSSTINFKENGDDYPRAASLLDRDVAPGDIVKVRGVTSEGDSITLWTYVRSLIADTVDSTVAAATADDDNSASQSASSSYVQVSGPENCITLTVDGTLYDGRVDGDISETYDIVVTQSSVDGDFTQARLRVISGSGNDDVAEVTPEAEDVATDIGTRGLTVAFSVTSTAACSASATAGDYNPSDLIVGQRWQVTVNQAFTPPTATSGGSYDNDVDTTYIITVTKGGLFSSENLPQITVSTTNGADVSGPTDVTDADTFVDVGTFGVTVKWDTAGLRKGDKYYVVVTGTADGPYRTIELGHNLDTDIPDSSEVDLTLFIRKALLQVEQNRDGFAPLTNWDTSATQITINSGIIAEDETWTDDGTPVALDVYSESSKSYGQVYVEYRAWRQELIGDINSIQDVGDLNTAISGPLHPDNPLKWGVFKALENANGVQVKFTAVADPDDDDAWVDVLDKLVGSDAVYGLVPLTRKRTVLDLYAAHVNSQSSPEQGLWRVLWVNLQGMPEIPIVSTGSTSVPGYSEATTTDGELALAVVEDDPRSSGTQYTQLRCTTSNSAFITNGVQAGDVVRLAFTSDGFGNETYSEYVVDTVQSEDQLLLLAGPDASINVAAKFEIWRNLTPTAEANAIAADAGSWGNRRVRAVWPDTIESSGTVMPGYFLCCSLAGLSSGVLPHQGMTHLEITGYSSVERTTQKFNRAQLDAMAVAGAWIVTQDSASGNIFTRQAVTTGDYSDINQREESVTRNVDSISYRFKDQFAPFIGVTNVTPVVQERLRLETLKMVRTLQTESNTTDLGGQLIDATIVSLAPHATFQDRYVLFLNITIPYALNNMDVHLVI